MRRLSKLIACYCLYSLLVGCMSLRPEKHVVVDGYRMMSFGCPVDSSLRILFHESSLLLPVEVEKDIKAKICNLIRQPYDEEDEDDIRYWPLPYVVVMHSDTELPLVVGISTDDIRAIYVLPIYEIRRIEGGFLIYVCLDTPIRKFIDIEVHSAVRDAMPEDVILRRFE